MDLPVEPLEPSISRQRLLLVASAVLASELDRVDRVRKGEASPSGVVDGELNEGLDQEQYQDQDHGHEQDKDQDHGYEQDKDQDHGYELDNDEDHGHEQDKDQDRGHEQDKDEEQGQGQEQEQEREQEPEQEQEREQEREQEQEQEQEQEDQKLNQSFDTSFDEGAKPDEVQIQLEGLHMATLFPEVIELIRQAQKLSVRNNRLSSLPPETRLLTNLHYLDLSYNQFAVFPAALTMLPNLEILDLSHNQLRTLPRDLGRLRTLQVLALAHNEFEYLPLAIAQLPKLAVLETDGNPLALPLMQIMGGSSVGMTSEEHRDRIALLREYMQDSLAGSPVDFDPDTSLETVLTYPAINHDSAETETSGSSASSTERLRSNSESVVSSRAAKRMGFVAKKGDSLDEESMLKHSRGLSFDSLTQLAQTGTPVQAPAKKLPPLVEDIGRRQVAETCGRLLFSFKTVHTSIRASAAECPDRVLAKKLESLLQSCVQACDPLERALAGLNEELAEVDLVVPDIVNLAVQCMAALKNVVTFYRASLDRLVGVQDMKVMRGALLDMVHGYAEMYNGWVVLKGASSSVAGGISANAGASANGTSVNANAGASANGTSVSASGAGASISTNVVAGPTTSSGAVSNTVTVSNITPANGPLTGSSTGATTATTTNTATASAIPLTISTGPQTTPTIPFPPAPLSNPLSNLSGTTTPSSPAVSDDNTPADDQLYEQIYSATNAAQTVLGQLTEAISRSALASTRTPALTMTAAVTSLVRDLTATCVAGVDVTKRLKVQLESIRDTGVVDRRRFWDDANGFLKAVINILASTKAAIEDLPFLNDARPNLATLSRLAKEIPSLLEGSSYRVWIDNSHQAQNQTQTQYVYAHAQGSHQYQYSQPFTPLSAQPPAAALGLALPPLGAALGQPASSPGMGMGLPSPHLGNPAPTTPIAAVLGSSSTVALSPSVNPAYSGYSPFIPDYLQDDSKSS